MNLHSSTSHNAFAKNGESHLLNKSPLLTSEETATWLGLKNKHTLEIWRSTKRYPELEYIKVGRLVRYKRDAIERFLLARTVCAE